MSATYISAVDTAKLVRAALKRNFPGVKFSVKSETYSGGASISIDWLDGPTRKQVQAVTGNYAGGRFDSSIDLAYSVTHYLNPDGSAVVAQSPGSAGSGGDDPSFKQLKPHPDAVRVRFLANHVFCTRRHSAGLVARALASIARKWGGFDPASLEIVSQNDGSAYCWEAGSIMIRSRGMWLDMMLNEELSRRTNYIPKIAA
jgi:hypothetical protein